MAKGFSIQLASGSGFCFGVRKALAMLEKAAGKRKRTIYTYGEIIHNPQVVEALERKGVRKVSSLGRLRRGDVLVISAHGAPHAVLKSARAKGLRLIDATCPFVARGQDYVKLLRDEGYEIIIIGDRHHREVLGLLANSAGRARVVTAAKEVKKKRLHRVGVVCQTTQRSELLREVAAALAPLAGELRVFNTICDATRKRQEGALELAARADVMLIVGGRNSANTRRLYEICRATCRRSYLIEVAEEIKPRWFADAAKVGVSAGASTPRRLIDGVMKRLRTISKQGGAGTSRDRIKS